MTKALTGQRTPKYGALLKRVAFNKVNSFGNVRRHLALLTTVE